jgi:hypothetical protein
MGFVINLYNYLYMEEEMAFCPKCRYEYEENVKICPDCNTELVDELPAEQAPADIKFVPLPNLPGRVYAEMLKGVLDKKGITCYIRGEGVLDAFQVSGTGPVNRGVKLYVPENRYDECLEIQHGMLDHI